MKKFLILLLILSFTLSGAACQKEPLSANEVAELINQELHENYHNYTAKVNLKGNYQVAGLGELTIDGESFYERSDLQEEEHLVAKINLEAKDGEQSDKEVLNIDNYLKNERLYAKFYLGDDVDNVVYYKDFKDFYDEREQDGGFFSLQRLNLISEQAKLVTQEKNVYTINVPVEVVISPVAKESDVNVKGEFVVQISGKNVKINQITLNYTGFENRVFDTVFPFMVFRRIGKPEVSMTTIYTDIKPHKKIKIKLSEDHDNIPSTNRMPCSQKEVDDWKDLKKQRGK